MYTIETQAAGQSAKEWPDDLVFTVLTKGFEEKCYDDKPFIQLIIKSVKVKMPKSFLTNLPKH